MREYKIYDHPFSNFPTTLLNLDKKRPSDTFVPRQNTVVATFTLHCYAYANACVPGAVTRRACTASIVLESLQATRVVRTSRSPSPPALFHRTLNQQGGEGRERKFVFPVWIFSLSPTGHRIRLASNRPSFLKLLSRILPLCATLSKTSLAGIRRKRWREIS